jgi:hypothetical protein
VRVSAVDQLRMVPEEGGPLIVVASVPCVSVDAIDSGYPGDNAPPKGEHEGEQAEKQPIPDANEDDGDGAHASGAVRPDRSLTRLGVWRGYTLLAATWAFEG